MNVNDTTLPGGGLIEGVPREVKDVLVLIIGVFPIVVSSAPLWLTVLRSLMIVGLSIARGVMGKKLYHTGLIFLMLSTVKSFSVTIMSLWTPLLIIVYGLEGAADLLVFHFWPQGYNYVRLGCVGFYGLVAGILAGMVTRAIASRRLARRIVVRMLVEWGLSLTYAALMVVLGTETYLIAIAFMYFVLGRKSGRSRTGGTPQDPQKGTRAAFRPAANTSI